MDAEDKDSVVEVAAEAQLPTDIITVETQQPATFLEADTSVVIAPLNNEKTLPVRQRQRHPDLPAALILLGAGWVASTLFRAFRRQQQQLVEACRHLRSVEERLAVREQAIEKKEDERKREQESHVGELSQQVADAQRELEAAREMCRLAATKLEQSMSDLSVTETELRAARTQLHTASRDLALTRAQLEATEGELGLTRSQNELMKREVDTLRRQLREAGQQLEGYIMVSRGHKDGVGRLGRGGGDFEDDLAPGLADWDL